MSLRPGVRRLIAAAAIASAAAASLLFALPADAHGFSSVVYVDASEPADDTVRTELELEYDLLVVSVSDFEDAPQFFEDGMDVFQTGDEASALNTHADEIERYVTERFAVTAGGQACDPARVGELGVTQREGVPYAMLTLDHTCVPSSVHEIRSELFPDGEEYVTGTVTVVEYELDGQNGSAALERADSGLHHGAAAARAVRALLRARRRAPAVRHRPHPVPARPDRRFTAPARRRARSDLVHRGALGDVHPRGARRRVGAGRDRRADHRPVDRGRGGVVPVAHLE